MPATSAPPVIYPEDRLSLRACLVTGFQHVVTMFGATVLGPLLMGFDPNTSILFSGVATLIFFVAVRGRIPSYLGSSFSFIAAVIAVTGYGGTGFNSSIAPALGGIFAAGAAYAAIGLLVMALGYRWLEILMPPVLTGVIVAVIGLNLAPVAVHQIGGGGFTVAMGFATILLVAGAAAFLPGFYGRLPVLIGGGCAYALYCLCANGWGLGEPVSFAALNDAAWFGLPRFTAPVFQPRAIGMIAPVALVLVAENLGHVRAVGAMTGRNYDPCMGRAFLGDGIATMVSSACGGTGVTTYAENIGVMAITRNFSSMTFVAAAGFAILFGLSPKFGAAVHTIPLPVIGGLSFVIFGLITATALRIWKESGTDFTDTRNLIVAGTGLVMGAGDLTVRIGDFALGGIAVATFSAIALYHLLGLRR